MANTTPWCLPPELLCSIFLLLDDRDRFDASNVCRYWRNVSLSYPATLWSTIMTWSRVQGAFRAHLERARDAPELSVCIYSQALCRIVDSIRELSSHMPRVRHLAIVVTPSQPPWSTNAVTDALAYHDASSTAAEALCALSAPALETLILLGRNAEHISIQGGFFRGSAPNLRALHVYGSFRLTPEACHSIIGVVILVLSVQESRVLVTAECIAALPHLRHLHVTIVREPHGDIPAYTLPSFTSALHSLSLEGNARVPAFARQFSLRAVRSLCLDYQPGVFDDIARSYDMTSVNISIVDSKVMSFKWDIEMRMRDGASVLVTALPVEAIPAHILSSAKELTLFESCLLADQVFPPITSVERLIIVLGFTSEPIQRRAQVFEIARAPNFFSDYPCTQIFYCPSLSELVVEARLDLRKLIPMRGRILVRPKVSTTQLSFCLKTGFYCSNRSCSWPSTVVFRGVDLIKDEMQKELFNVVKVVEEDLAEHESGGATRYDATSYFPLWNETRRWIL
ncbi:hypothetical protein EXIGLDRAFT_762455 [Exidia glandulosa HHB12029]|uniref:F-box domain-containing protein n=1 Tax=Exidia glandulosa HHB12029 TaxID=1314781 RepID=A0A165MPN5_EXIGL|nr:hypothetical protein EXIGLDRAFT_762455 [Exidia glandulosa HHB12029]